MLKLFITNKVRPKIVVSEDFAKIISMRPLSRREIMIARQFKLQRYYLPVLTRDETEEFFGKFNEFWDHLVKPFSAEDSFWRNAVSSKMQEWERSIVYFSLILYSLSKKTANTHQTIIFVCSSLEEEKLCYRWGKTQGWQVLSKPHLSIQYRFRCTKQEFLNLIQFLRVFISLFCKKLS